MNGFLLAADDVLRRRRWTTQSDRPMLALASLICCIGLFGAMYGAVMGTFGSLADQESWLVQVLYSAIKVPLLLLATFLVSLPSFFVFNTLFGLRQHFLQAIRALMAAQAGLAIILAAFAPFTMLFYASSANYPQAVLFNAVMFAAASLTAQWLLRGYYRPLVAISSKHRRLLWAWIGLYAFVGIQMGWILRPFVGAPSEDVRFFREDAWDNAYVRVVRLIWTALAG